MARTIVVTGSASGLGKATAEAIEAAGDRVIRVDYREGDITADLSTRGGRSAAISEIRALAPASLDGIVTWAGLGGGGVATLLVNYFGTVELVEGVRDLLTGSSAPRVVVTSSRMSLFPADASLVQRLLAEDLDAIEQLGDEDEATKYYRASKTAVARWMRRKAIDADWGGVGIAVNAIAPGLIETPMTRGALDDAEMSGPLLEMHPQANATLSQPDEIAAIAQFLASERAGLLMGQCLFADRGTEAIERGDERW